MIKKRKVRIKKEYTYIKRKKKQKIKKRNNSFSTESIEDKKKYFFIFDVVPRCIPKEKRETKNTLRRKKDQDEEEEAQKKFFKKRKRNKKYGLSRSVLEHTVSLCLTLFYFLTCFSFPFSFLFLFSSFFFVFGSFFLFFSVFYFCFHISWAPVRRRTSSPTPKPRDSKENGNTVSQSLTFFTAYRKETNPERVIRHANRKLVRYVYHARYFMKARLRKTRRKLKMERNPGKRKYGKEL